MTLAAGRPLRQAPMRGLAYMGAGVFFMCVLDAASKALAGNYSLAQITFIMRIPGPFFALALALADGGLASLGTRRLRWHLLRSAASATTGVSFVASLRFLPLADAVAISFVSPLLMCGLSVLILRERVGPRRWAAILAGFAGVAIVLQPSGAGFGPGSALALLAALSYALSLNLLRLMSRTESSPAMLFWFSLFVLAGAGLLTPFDWRTPDLADALLFALLALAGTIGQFLLIQAFRYGQVSLLAPLEYSALIWATAFGFLFWDQLPTPTVFLGAAVIILSSLYVVHREALAARRARLDAASAPSHLPEA